MIGGILKDWTFYSCVCISAVGQIAKYKQTHRHSLSKLDKKFKKFPIKQAMNFHLKRFVRGITPYVTSADGPLSKRKLSTSAMSNLDSQDIPGLVLQMLVILGADDTVLPNNFVVEEGTDLKEVALRSGYKALNLFLNLRRTSFTNEQLEDLIVQTRSLHYDMYSLFRCKQILLGINSNYGGMILLK